MKLHDSHNWRYSDSSQYDAVCINCNYTDTSPQAEFPCNSVLKSSRLLDLARQAGLKAYSELKLSSQEQKFAELIIRECIDICINENVSSLDVSVILESSKRDIQRLATISCGEELSNIIKKRFGIE